ncbi:MAG: Crp/Fnr family transcriptional regulator [Candidatus Krumholzibacteria bacterium]|nr:Crp/Fnr family transcriptional regulator [Candidatus Krumholzibacteria bacterium]
MSENFEKPFCTYCETRITSVLKSVDEPQLDVVASAKACNLYKKGQLIFQEGGSPSGLFCIHQGKVKVYKTGEEGRDQIVRFAKPGDVVGYRSLVSGEPYNLSAAALEDCVICCIPSDTFFGMLREDGKFTMDMIQLLSGQLRKAEDQLVHLAQKPVRERLAETLLILKEVYGTEDGDQSALNIKLSRDELAAVVGTATETLVRTIADLKRENLIATEKKKIYILDVDGLIRAGNLQD